jgi:hypothetical protein
VSSLTPVARTQVFLHQNKRWPSELSMEPEEAQLGSWLNERCNELRTGMLPARMRAALARELPGWAHCPEGQWLHLARSASSTLLEYGPEGVTEERLRWWLRSQVDQEHFGTISPRMLAWLDGHAPLWRLAAADPLGDEPTMVRGIHRG